MILSNHQLFQEFKQKQVQLQAFRESTGTSLQTMLDQYEWGIVSGAGHQGLPLLTLRLDHRIVLDDPFLLSLAEQAEKTWGPVDFSLFSGEGRRSHSGSRSSTKSSHTGSTWPVMSPTSTTATWVWVAYPAAEAVISNVPASSKPAYQVVHR